MATKKKSKVVKQTKTNIELTLTSLYRPVVKHGDGKIFISDVAFTSEEAAIGWISEAYKDRSDVSFGVKKFWNECYL
ncbi:MAG TPA: hypothetical protein VIJ14_09865 [Rhabdochlamydiaceae bacterium]